MQKKLLFSFSTKYAFIIAALVRAYRKIQIFNLFTSYVNNYLRNVNNKI